LEYGIKNKASFYSKKTSFLFELVEILGAEKLLDSFHSLEEKSLREKYVECQLPA
jgi:hypothetical protein